MDWSMAMTGTVFAGIGFSSRRLERILSWVIGLNHAPGCIHRDSNGRIPIGATPAGRLIFRCFAIFGLLEIFVGLAFIVGSLFRTNL
jgi:hypothetical protein